LLKHVYILVTLALTVTIALADDSDVNPIEDDFDEV